MALLMMSVPVQVNASRTSLHLQAEEEKDTADGKSKSSSVVSAPGSSVRTVSGSGKAKNVKTGDETAAVPSMIVCLAAGAGICMLVYHKASKYFKEK